MSGRRIWAETGKLEKVRTSANNAITDLTSFI
jgi:hypothetical protein